MTPGMLEYQLTVEKRLEERAQSLLDRAVGYGNALVRVTAELDFPQRESVEETYDPDASVVRSERDVQESGGAQIAGGVPGAQGNLGGGRRRCAGTPASRSEESTNYEVSKVVRKMVEPVGTVKTVFGGGADGRPADARRRRQGAGRTCRATRRKSRASSR